MAAGRFLPPEDRKTDTSSETLYDPARPIFFMHVPKTSGLSMTRSLVDAIQPRIIFQGFDQSTFGSFQDFASIDRELRKTICLDSRTIPPDADLVAGHLSYSTLSRVNPRAHLVTVLREPISRILSHWLYLRALPDESLVRWGEWSRYTRWARRPLEDFLAREDLGCQIDNLAVRMLLWPHPQIPAAGFIDTRYDERLIDEATRRVERFAFIDAIENLDFPASLARWLGKSLSYGRDNETPAVPTELRSQLHEELSPEAIELLESHSRLDYQLWAKIVARGVTHLRSETFQKQVLMKTVARFAGLLSPATDG